MLFDPICRVQIGRDQHEAEIRFRRNDAQSEQLGRFEARISWTSDESAILAVRCSSALSNCHCAELDPVKKMETMPALFGNKRSVFLSAIALASAVNRAGQDTVASGSRMPFRDKFVHISI